MKTLKKVFCHFEEETCSAIEYSKCAVKLKDEDPTLSRLYLEMAKTEHKHATELFAYAQRKMQVISSEDGSGFLGEMFDLKMAEMTDKLADVKAYLDIAAQM